MDLFLSIHISVFRFSSSCRFAQFTSAMLRFQIYINQRTRIMIFLSFKKEAFNVKKKRVLDRLKKYSKISNCSWILRNAEKYINISKNSEKYLKLHDFYWYDYYWWFSDHEDNYIVIGCCMYPLLITYQINQRTNIATITGYILNNYRDCYDNYRDAMFDRCLWSINICSRLSTSQPWK